MRHPSYDSQLDKRRKRWQDHADELHAIVQETSPLVVQWAAEAPADAEDE